MKRQNLITLLFLGLVTPAALFVAPSCTPEQLQRGDRLFADVNQVGTAVRTGTNAPGMPLPIRTGGELIGGLAALALLAWREIRASKILEKSDQKSVALNAIADGVDQAPSKAAAEVKRAIKDVMQGREILSTINPIVDEHRSKLAT